MSLINVMAEWIKRNPGTKILNTPICVPFSAPLINGQYQFNNNVFAFDARPGVLNVISNISFTSNLDQLNFSRALDLNFQNGIFLLDIVLTGNNQTVTPKPIPFSSFQNKLDIDIYFKCNATKADVNQEEVNFTLSGRLDQTSEIIDLDLNPIIIYANATIYQISDQKFLEYWLG